MQYYGQSATPEDKIAHTVFGDDFVGTCVEVGAYNGVDLSNTYFFYLRGWQCVNFEPHPDNYAALCRNQPNAINHNYAVSNEAAPVPKPEIMYTAPGKPIVTGFNLPEWYVKSEIPGGYAGLKEITVGTVSLEKMLAHDHIDSVDYVSIDTDGTEMDVLAGLDFSRWQPRLFIVEYNHALDDMKRLFFERGYRLAHDNGLNGFWTRTQADYDAVRRAVR